VKKETLQIYSGWLWFAYYPWQEAFDVGIMEKMKP